MQIFRVCSNIACTVDYTCRLPYLVYTNFIGINNHNCSHFGYSTAFPLQQTTNSLSFFLIRRKRARIIIKVIIIIHLYSAFSTLMTEGARQERHEKRETTCTATENGLSQSSDFFCREN